MGVPILGRHRMALEETAVRGLWSVVCECGFREAAPWGEDQAVMMAERHLEAVGQPVPKRVYL